MNKFQPSTKKLLTLTIGAGISFLGLTADWLGFGGAVGLGENQQILIGIGGAIILLGWLIRVEDFETLQTIGKRLAVLYHGLALLVLNTLVLFIGLELAARGANRALDKVRGTPQTVPRAVSDWEPTYWREFHGSDHAQYYPYTIWRNVPFNGSLLKVSAEGLRHTPGAICEPGAYTVFVFGGSTMWGHGAPDWGTIPAYLQAGLQEQLDSPVCVVNFGQKGYVSTQGMVELSLQLQQGYIPDLVIFYDGSNDLAAASDQTGITFPHLQLHQIKTRYEHPLVSWAMESYLIKFTFRLKAALPEITTPDALAAQMAATYLGNYHLVSALAKEYKFEFAFFLQPVILATEKPLTPYEKTILATSIQAYEPLYQSAYTTIQSQTLPHLFYLGDVFDGVAQEIFVDFVHITPEGNQLVAEAMLHALFGGTP